jgi:hypothetical protein
MRLNHKQSASLTRFDNTSNGFTADNAQSAIEEAMLAAQPSAVSCLFYSIHAITKNEEFSCDGISRIALNSLSVYSSPRVVHVDESPYILKTFKDRINR